STTRLVHGTWYHLVGTYDGAAARLYVNGALEGTGSGSATINSTFPLLIGRLNSGGERFHGLIDEVAVSDRPLGAAEVQAVYAAGRAGQPFVASSPHYTIRYVTGALTVTPAPLAITADNQTKVAGNPVPTLTARSAGFVNGDGVSRLSTPVTLSTYLGDTAGDYPIVPSGATSADYNITFVNGTLTVTRYASNTALTSSSETSTYGQSVTFTAFVTSSGAPL